MPYCSYFINGKIKVKVKERSRNLLSPEIVFSSEEMTPSPASNSHATLPEGDMVKNKYVFQMRRR